MKVEGGDWAPLLWQNKRKIYKVKKESCYWEMRRKIRKEKFHNCKQKIKVFKKLNYILKLFIFKLYYIKKYLSLWRIIEDKEGKWLINRKGKKKWLRRSVEGNEAAYFSFPCYMRSCHFEQLGDKYKIQRLNRLSKTRPQVCLKQELPLINAGNTAKVSKALFEIIFCKQ